MTDGDLGTEWKSRERESIDILLFGLGFRALGFRILGFRVLGFRV